MVGCLGGPLYSTLSIMYVAEQCMGDCINVETPLRREKAVGKCLSRSIKMEEIWKGLEKIE